MFKKFLITLLFISFSLLPAFSVDLDSLLNRYERVFIYFYTSNCGYCDKFNPIYDKITSAFDGKNCKFIKIDAENPNNMKIMMELGAFYVPYVIMLDNKNKQAKSVVPKCLLNYACTKDAVDKFVN